MRTSNFKLQTSNNNLLICVHLTSTSSVESRASAVKKFLRVRFATSRSLDFLAVAKRCLDRRKLMKTLGLYLNGRFVEGAGLPGRAVDVVNPSTGEVVGRVGTTDANGVRRAIEDAQAAFASWRELPAKARGDYLLAIASELEKRRDEIAKTITLENGKPLAQSKGEVGMSVDHLRWFAEEAKRAYGRIVPNQVGGKRNLVIKSPVGVVGAIAPWNFPLVL